MTFLPIVGRELIEAARRRGTYWMRVGAAGAGLLVGGWIMLLMRSQQSLGIYLFVALAIIIYVYCLLVGVFRTADCLSEEKREGTLGLLFLTDLKGYDIVLGKLAASSLNAFYGVLALFPVMAIPLLVGGVTVQEFWRVVLVALNVMFFSMAVGMFASSISRDERRAMLAAFLIVLFFAGGFPFLAALLESKWISRSYAEFLLIPSPGYAAVMAFDATGKTATPNYFYFSVLFTHSVSWLLLIAASRIVPRTWQDRALIPVPDRWRRWLRELETGSAAYRQRLRQRLLGINPVYWLVGRHRMKLVAIWGLMGAGGLVWILGLLFDPHGWKQEETCIWTSILAHLVLKFWVATEASRRFSLDRQSGALELLVSTPLPVREIVRGQMMGLERQFGAPMVAVLLADFVFLLSGQRNTEMVVLWLVWMVVLVADLLALSWVGMWRGLNSRRPNRAAAAALVRVLFIPWMVFLISMTLGAIVDAFGRRFSHWEGTFFIIYWGLLALIVDAIMGFPARRNLLARFRETVAQRFESGRRQG